MNLGRSLRAFVVIACLALSACQSPTQIMVLVDGDDAVWRGPD